MPTSIRIPLNIRTARLLKELGKLKSNTLEYPCEIALRDHANEMEGDLRDATQIIEAMVIATKRGGMNGMEEAISILSRDGRNFLLNQAKHRNAI